MEMWVAQEGDGSKKNVGVESKPISGGGEEEETCILRRHSFFLGPKNYLLLYAYFAKKFFEN